MDSQGNPTLPQFPTGQAVGRGVLLVMATLVALSCARVPPALRTKITVTGSVLVAAGGPLPGTALFFTPTEVMPDQNTYAVADSSGAYSVRLISGTYDVRLSPPDGHGFLARTEQVTISGKHSRLDVTFGGFRVTGRVVAPNGPWVDSGQVSATLMAPGHSVAISTIKQGSYSLHLPGGRYSFLAGAAGYWSGFYPVWQESVPIDADTTIDFHLGGISVSGKVLGPDGLPIKDVGVEAQSKSHFVQNRTAADGRYQLYLPADSYQVWFRPPYPFFIVPRVVGPVTITKPTSIDGDLSGIEWAGTIRRAGTDEPVPGIYVWVQMTSDDKRSAAIRTDSLGNFRFVLEADQHYDLETQDPVSREQEVWLHDATASADTTVVIFIPPASRATRADSTIKLSIRPVSGKTVHLTKEHWAPDWIEVTLLNTDPDTVTLVMPGDGSFWGRRTPLMDWEIRVPGGPRLKRMPLALCGNINPLRGDEVFKLPPGAQRTFRTALPEYYPYEKSRRYQVRLSYENRPHLAWAGVLLGPHDANALRLLRDSTPCKLVSNTLELEVW